MCVCVSGDTSRQKRDSQCLPWPGKGYKWMILAKCMVNGEKWICDDLATLWLIQWQELSHFITLKTLLFGGKSAKPVYPCLAVAILCVHLWCGAGYGGGTAMACGIPGHPSGASFIGAEWGKGVELSQEASAQGMLWPQLLGLPSWCVSPGLGAFWAADSLRSFCRGKGKPGKGCWIRSCLVPAGDTLGELGHTLFLVSRKPTLLRTGGPGLLYVSQGFCKVTASVSSLISPPAAMPLFTRPGLLNRGFQKKKKA